MATGPQGTDPSSYVPHEGDSILLDQVWQVTPGLTRASATVRDAAPFSDEAGGWPSWLVVELMAQVVAASAGLREFRPGVRARLGLLIGVRSFACRQDFFPTGTPLQIEATESTRDESGMGVFDCTLASGGTDMASGVLTVYLPESADDYLESLEP